ncbi:hypothetical protein E2C01_099223 [Portunus trituberculatus]|uniref:Uncharacterized protein n=1 Tax=Portunus trituberculatus TaxID=210409 RepID=A0A5B7JZS6_PORTR|nr:hypothetical protein [Portunus trituberculatus]
MMNGRKGVSVNGKNTKDATIEGRGGRGGGGGGEGTKDKGEVKKKMKGEVEKWSPDNGSLSSSSSFSSSPSQFQKPN